MTMGDGLDYSVPVPVGSISLPREIEPRELTVASVNWKGHMKRIRLEPGSVWLEVPRSACVSFGDRVRVTNGQAWVHCNNGECELLPPYATLEYLSLGGLRLTVLIKEVTEPEEYSSYQALADLHYRGDTLHGRNAKLIVRSFDPAFPTVIGFIELATPFFMNKARARVLDAPFESGDSKWESWDISTLRESIHLIVRIARTVVSPEFRGFGVGQKLVKHAARFAAKRWQVSGYLPCFLEISADMLKYVPFVERAGMRYVGDTEGNLTRVSKDMTYLIGRFSDDGQDKSKFEKISGILDQQVTRMDRSLALMEQQQIDLGEFTKRLRRLTERSVLKDFDLFRGIVSLPKPTFMMGLNVNATKFLNQRIKDLSPQRTRQDDLVEIAPLDSPIRISNLTITYLSQVQRTLTTHAVQQAFDISPRDIRTTVVRDFDLEIQPGEVILIVGPSGSGKTTLLEAIEERVNGRRVQIEGSVATPPNFNPGTFRTIRSRKPLIELFGKGDIRRGLYLLGLAGLSEPFLYLKRFDELSRGQQYRSMLAKLLASNSNAWIADEFCANLDSVTSNLVSHNTQRIARRYRITFIAAASNCREFIGSLLPDRVVVLTSATEHSIYSGSDYIRMLNGHTNFDTAAQRIRVFPEMLAAVREGRKRTTIRKGRKQFCPGLALLTSRRDSSLVRITGIEHKRFSQLTDDDAKADGSADATNLKALLRSIYPGIRANSVVTIVSFSNLCGVVEARSTANARIREGRQ